MVGLRDRYAKAAPDLVKRQFKAAGINQLWVADMTYVTTWLGFLYLDVVVDVYRRKVVGWAFGERMTSDLVVAALDMALHTRRPESVIHHSDQGSQYTSVAFGKRCEEMRASRRWARWGMPTTTRWRRASSRPWSANS